MQGTRIARIEKLEAELQERGLELPARPQAGDVNETERLSPISALLCWLLTGKRRWREDCDPDGAYILALEQHEQELADRLLAYESEHRAREERLIELREEDELVATLRNNIEGYRSLLADQDIPPEPEPPADEPPRPQDIVSEVDRSAAETWLAWQREYRSRLTRWACDLQAMVLGREMHAAVQQAEQERDAAVAEAKQLADAARAQAEQEAAAAMAKAQADMEAAQRAADEAEATMSDEDRRRQEQLQAVLRRVAKQAGLKQLDIETELDLSRFVFESLDKGLSLHSPFFVNSLSTFVNKAKQGRRAQP